MGFSRLAGRRSGAGAITVCLVLLALLVGAPASHAAIPQFDAGARFGTGEVSSYPRMLVNDAGDGILVWYDIEHPGDDLIHISTMAAGGAWSAEAIPPGAADVDSLVVDMNAAGSALVAWREGTGKIQLLILPKGGNPVGPLTLFDGTSVENGVDAAIDGAGRVTIAWVNAADGRVEMRYRDAQGAWGSTMAASADGTNPSQIAVDASEAGRVAMSWFSENVRLRATVFEANIANVVVGAEVVSGDDGDILNNDVAVDSSGRVSVIWQEPSAAGEAVVGADLPSGASSFGAPTAIHDGSGDVYQLNMASNEAGKQVLAWSRGSLHSVSYETATRLPGAGWAGAHKWGEDNDFGPFGSVSWNLVSRPAINGAGTEALISANNPMVTVRAAGEGWPAAVDIASGEADAYGKGPAYGYDPNIAIDAQGRVHVAWRNYDGHLILSRSVAANGGGGGGGGGGGVTKPKLTASVVPRQRLARVLRSGLVLTTKCAPTCVVTGTAAAPRLARAATGRANVNGTRKIGLKFSAAAKRRLARAKAVKLVVVVRGSNSAGAASKRIVVTIRR